MTTPGSPPSGNSVGPSVPPTHTGAGDPAKTGTTPTHSVSPHPPGKSIPEGGDGGQGRNNGLPENVQPAGATGSMVSPKGTKGSPDEVKRQLNELLKAEQPLAQSFRKREEMRYIEKTSSTLMKIHEEMSGKWDNPKDVKKVFKKAHKEICENLGDSNVKITFNVPGGKSVCLIPPDLENFELAELESWVETSQKLVEGLKSKHESDYAEDLIEKEIDSGTKSFKRLLSQLAQSGASSDQEIQAFQAEFESIEHPIIELSFDGINLNSSGRLSDVSSRGPEEPRPSIKITNDPDKESLGAEDRDSAFEEEELSPEEAERKRQTEKQKRLVKADLRSKLGGVAKECESDFEKVGEVAKDLKGLVAGNPDHDIDQGILPSQLGFRSKYTNQPSPEPVDDGSSGIASLADELSPRRPSGDQPEEPVRRVHFDDDDRISSLSTQSLPMFRVKNDDGLGLFRALFAYHTGDSGWEYDSEVKVRAKMRDDVIAEPIKLAIRKATTEYLDLDSYNTAQRTIAQRMDDLDKQGRLVEEIFDKAVVNGTFSDRTFSHLPEVLGITDVMASDPDPYALEMRTLSKFIMDELPAALNVPVSSDDGQPGFRRLNEGFGVVLGADGYEDDEDDASTVSSSLSPLRGEQPTTIQPQPLRTDLPEDGIPDFQASTAGGDRVETPSSVSDQGQRGLVSELSIAEGLKSPRPLDKMSEEEISLFTEHKLWEHLNFHEIRMIEGDGSFPSLLEYRGLSELIPEEFSREKLDEGRKPGEIAVFRLPTFGELCQRYYDTHGLELPSATEGEQSPAVSPGLSSVASPAPSSAMPSQPLGAGEVVNEDGVGLFRALFAYQTGDSSWKSADSDKVRSKMTEDGVSVPIKTAIRKAMEQYPDFPIPGEVLATITTAQNSDQAGRVDDLVDQIFAHAIMNGKFSNEAFSGLHQALGIHTDDSNAYGLQTLSRLIVRNLTIDLKVPLKREGDNFRLDVDSGYWDSEENADSSVVIRPLPTETRPSPPETIPSPRDEVAPQSPNMDMGVTLNSEGGSPVLQPLTGRDSVEEPDDTSSLPPTRDEVEVMPPAEDDTIHESVEADSARPDSEPLPPPPPPPGDFERWLEKNKYRK